jgi:PIN domain nuclease of toxin-antitoxin system
MQYLLDTHVLIWWITSDHRLSSKAEAMIKSHRNTLFWSVASTWEISIKHSLGRLVFEEPPEDLLPSELNRNHIEILPIMNEHAFRAGQQPEHHRDPFDRMLVAQAQVESLGIISNDRQLRRYDVDVFW